MVGLNRAVAVAMRHGPLAGLVLIDAILARGDLEDYHLAHSARRTYAGGWAEERKRAPLTNAHSALHGRGRSDAFLSGV